MQRRAAPIALRYRASISRASACSRQPGRVLATPTRTGPNQDSTPSGQREERSSSARRPQHFAGHPLPALAHQLVERPGGFALDHEHAVVERRARRPADPAAARLARAVLGAVPATGAEVDPAAERQAAVDHHELLVMARRRRMVGIQDEIEATRLCHPEFQLGQRLTIEAVEQRPVPDQHPDVQGRARGEQLPEELAEGRRIARGVEADIAADVPADDVHRHPGLQQGAAQGIEIRGAVDQQGRPLRPGNAPAGDVLLEQRGAIAQRRANVGAADVDVSSSHDRPPQDRSYIPRLGGSEPAAGAHWLDHAGQPVRSSTSRYTAHTVASPSAGVLRAPGTWLRKRCRETVLSMSITES